MNLRKNKTALASLCLAAATLISCTVPTFPGSAAVKPGEVTGVELSDYSSYSIQAADVNQSFMRGVDMSEVKALEELGQKWYDSDNTQKDVFRILAGHGVNWVRLRIWNDYTKSLQDDWGPYGYNNLSRTINMAERAKAAGLKLLLDFHYSDNWADPKEQKCPEMWSSISDAEQLAEAVGSWTEEILQSMIEQDCAPDMVQLGNEMQGGLFQTGSSVADAKNYTGTYLRKAALAVRKLLPDCGIMLHMSNGDRSDYLSRLTAYAEEIGNDPDEKKLVTILGFSYYTYFHGTDSALKTNLQSAKAAGYKVVMAENSYAYSTSAYTDSYNNEFWTDDEVSGAAKLTGYTYGSGITSNSDGSSIIQATIENQAGVIRYLMELVGSVDSEGGYFYWGGAYLGIAPKMPSSWENQALFDVDGKVLPGMDVYNVK